MNDRARIKYVEELEKIKELRKRGREVRLKRLEEEEERSPRGEKRKAAGDKNADPEKVREDNLQ